jgi:predicted RNase H-like nuclease (RuvC/YqgF family)
MLALTKTWIWIKHHWKIVAISAWTLFVWLMSRKNVDMYKKILENTIDNYKNEMEVLKSSRDKEQKDKEEAIRLRDESLERLEREFEHREESLSYEKRARYLEQKINPDDHGFDEIMQIGDSDFSSSGLKEPSVIRVGRLAVVEGNVLLGAIGEICSDRLQRVKANLSDWLIQS